MNGVPTTLNKAGQSGYDTGFPATYTDPNNPAWEIYNSNLQRRGTNANANLNTDNHPVLSASGNWVSSSTGQPWHGSYNNPNGTTQYFSNGRQVQDIGQVGLQQPQLGVQQLPKNPALSAQVAGAIGQNAASSSLLSKSFADYLAEAQQQGEAGAAQLSQSEAAINPTPTTARLNADVSTAAKDLGQTINQYTAAQEKNQADIANANRNYQDVQDKNLSSLSTTLAAENQNYGTAAQNVANQAYANALKQINSYQLASGTPASGSGALSNRYIAAYDAVNLPLQQELANRALATTNQLYGLGSNLQNQYLQNLMGQYGGVASLNADIANRATSANQYLTGLDTQTAQYLQSLQQQVAQLAPELRMQYLQSLGIPIQTAQAIISGNTANLSQLAGLDQLANWYNVYGTYQPNYPSFISPRVTLPGGGTATATSGGLNNTFDQAAQQQDWLAQAQQGWLQTPQGQAWLGQNRTGTNSYVPPQPAAAGGLVAGQDYATA